MTKKDLRIIYKEKRLALPALQRSKLDDLMLIQFKKLSIGDIHVVMSFWPMEERAEMNTHLFTRYLSHLIPGLKVCFPVTDPESNSMNAIIVDQETTLEENNYGITEPVGGEEINSMDIDLIFLPLFASRRRRTLASEGLACLVRGAGS